jgi:hypothetical protein
MELFCADVHLPRQAKAECAPGSSSYWSGRDSDCEILRGDFSVRVQGGALVQLLEMSSEDFPDATCMVRI